MNSGYRIAQKIRIKLIKQKGLKNLALGMEDGALMSTRGSSSHLGSTARTGTRFKNI
jgi:hypothetical protein